MKKKRISFYFITFMLFCQELLRKSCSLSVTSKMIAATIILFGFLSGQYLPAMAISEEQMAAIQNNCETIRANLKSLQYSDSRTRVYLGRHYETILTKFITPLNVRLVENNLSDNDLIDNQNNFVARRTDFVEDFVLYQKSLDNLVAIDCKAEPERFYEVLVETRKARKIVENDVIGIKKLALQQIELVKRLRGEL